MSVTRILPIIALIITLSVPAVVSAQVPVEVSGERVVSGGKVYLMHEVQKSQTLYSISRAYRVPIDNITRENEIPVNGIQTGQILRIPVNEQQASVPAQTRPAAQVSTPPAQTRPAAQQTTTPAQSRPAAQQTTPPAQTRQAAQPAARGVQTTDDSGIAISSEKVVTSGRTFYMHQVQKGQTLYSIAKAYKVTILDIDRENAIPAGGLQAGQMLKIPASTALRVIEEETPPAETTMPTNRPADAGTTTYREPAANATAMPRQETPQQTTQLPRQETPQQATQMPRQEQPAATPGTPKPAAQQSAAATPETTKPATQQNAAATAAEVKDKAGPGVKPEASVQTAAQQQTPPAPKSEEKAKAAPKKIHKVQKGESLADIAKKYDITLQELKQANKGVIFAMPDMRLVIPAKED